MLKIKFNIFPVIILMAFQCNTSFTSEHDTSVTSQRELNYFSMDHDGQWRLNSTKIKTVEDFDTANNEFFNNILNQNILNQNLNIPVCLRLQYELLEHRIKLQTPQKMDWTVYAQQYPAAICAYVGVTMGSILAVGLMILGFMEQYNKKRS
ncbi:hypothetical protein EKK58_04085 [Candidatus Dependentiae bacterium]|nr:MAG: hypothetical protein EKK58_04085 [Candidatus Dependentiae bacterium]